MSDADDPHQLSRQTTPTWEVELLISGVAVFAMLQLPGWLDERFFLLDPQFADEWRMALMLAYFYAKSAAVVLATTFAIHLLLRAQWIALVGMHSVYPDGVRLDRMKMGPIQRSVEETRQERTSDAIERADNRASVVFAIGVSVAVIIATLCIALCSSMLIATLVTGTLGLQFNPVAMFSVLCIAIMGPFFVAAGLDQALAGRIAEGGVLHRAIARVLRFYTRIGMGRRNNRIIAILVSNGGERRMMALVIGSMLTAITAVCVGYILTRTNDAFGSYGQFPSSKTAGIDAAHYDDQRDPVRDGASPYLQSSVVVGPYLQLVVPYRPNRDEPAMRKRCLPPADADKEALARARLGCLQSLHAVALDGQALQELRYDIASDPRTGRPALLAMIDVRDLPRGRHELRIARPLRGDRAREADDRDPGYDTIVFWR